MLQYPHFVEQFQTSTLLQHSKNEYADTSSTNTLLRAHRQMIRLRTMDHILHNAQRQGRISFYMTHHGEEAIQMGSASALQPQDFIFAQYREAGLLMWRGFTLDQFCNQCFSNDMDLGKGRQMPVHYGCRALNYQTVSRLILRRRKRRNQPFPLSTLVMGLPLLSTFTLHVTLHPRSRRPRSSSVGIMVMLFQLPLKINMQVMVLFLEHQATGWQVFVWMEMISLQYMQLLPRHVSWQSKLQPP
jgi:hypothetical protein